MPRNFVNLFCLLVVLCLGAMAVPAQVPTPMPVPSKKPPKDPKIKTFPPPPGSDTPGVFEGDDDLTSEKSMVVDGLWTIVGSSNFDDRSFRLNDEVNVNIYDEDIAAQMEQMFFEDLARSEEITRRRFLKRSWIDKVKERVAGWLKPQL